ncbi:MAG: hypothetical protein BWY50_01780 [Spirochaetes bacterium ADurb.Bin315]|jgi:hypothetical protein|nr:hypothetical protein [Spirochaetales bacterium]OQA41521.1 MAG: hypothetical protein BWY50_01780 [Spirochaetes bacterium ADurb.Bin315]
MINWNYYPKNTRIPDHLNQIIKVFEKNQDNIDSSINQLASNEVLKRITNDIVGLGFKVEKSKKKADLIRVPVLFGLNGKEIVSYEVDAYNSMNRTVIEVEAGRAVTNYQFLKDFFECCMMYDVEYLCIAVRNIYRKSKDFDIVCNFFESFYTCNRVKISLKGILIIGY